MAELKSTISSYRDLVVWQEAMDLVVETYRLTETFPKTEQFGLTSQLRRCGVSIPSNIAEGYGRDNKGSYVQQLRVAQGSLKELETQFLIAERIGVIDEASLAKILLLAEKVGKLLRGLIRALEHSK